MFHVITLKEVPERSKRVQNLLNKYHFDYKLHVFNKHAKPVIGCFQSHISLYKYAKEQQMNYILILEDNISDTENTKYFKKSLPEIVNFLNTNNCDILYLSLFLNPFLTWDNRYGNFYKIHNDPFVTVGTMAYIIKYPCYSDILNNLEMLEALLDHKQLDHFHQKYNRYAYRPLFFTRAPDIVSITNPGAEMIRQIYFSPRVAEMTEKLFFNGLLRAITYSLIVLAVLVFLLLLNIVIYVSCKLKNK